MPNDSFDQLKTQLAAAQAECAELRRVAGLAVERWQEADCESVAGSSHDATMGDLVAALASPTCAEGLVAVQMEDLVRLREYVAATCQAECAALRRAAADIALAQPYFPDTVTGKRQEWVKQQIAEKILALASPTCAERLEAAIGKAVEALEWWPELRHLEARTEQKDALVTLREWVKP